MFPHQTANAIPLVMPQGIGIVDGAAAKVAANQTTNIHASATKTVIAAGPAGRDVTTLTIKTDQTANVGTGGIMAAGPGMADLATLVDANQTTGIGAGRTIALSNNRC